MKIEFDPDADAVYIQFNDADVFDTQEARHGIFVDIDEHDEPIGIEIINASEWFAMQDFIWFTFEIF